MPSQRWRHIVDKHAASQEEGASYTTAFRRVTIRVIFPLVTGVPRARRRYCSPPKLPWRFRRRPVAPHFSPSAGPLITPRKLTTLPRRALVRYNGGSVNRNCSPWLGEGVGFGGCCQRTA